jgi:hypothetical protein
MIRMRVSVAILLALFSASIAGCGGASSASSTITIHDLSWSPKTAPLGVLTTFASTFSYEDPSGDLAGADVDWTNPAGQTVALPPGAFTSTMVPGVFSGALQLNAPTAGKYFFDIWLIDSAGHPSNKLTGTVDIQ